MKASGPSEAAIQADVRLALGRERHVRMFRNEVGEAWIGQIAHREGDTITLGRPRRVPFGLAPGSGDLIGWTSVVVTPDMVGLTLAVFTSAEIKRPTIPRLPDDQQNWHDVVRAAGGRAAMVRSVEDALTLVRTP